MIYTAQQTYDLVAHALARQGRACAAGPMTLLRTRDGLRDAVGHLIPDAHLDPTGEGSDPWPGGSMARRTAYAARCRPSEIRAFLLDEKPVIAECGAERYFALVGHDPALVDRLAEAHDSALRDPGTRPGQSGPRPWLVAWRERMRDLAHAWGLSPLAAEGPAVLLEIGRSEGLRFELYAPDGDADVALGSAHHDPATAHWGLVRDSQRVRSVTAAVRPALLGPSEHHQISWSQDGLVVAVRARIELSQKIAALRRQADLLEQGLSPGLGEGRAEVLP